MVPSSDLIRNHFVQPWHESGIEITNEGLAHLLTVFAAVLPHVIGTSFLHVPNFFTHAGNHPLVALFGWDGSITPRDF